MEYQMIVTREEVAVMVAKAVGLNGTQRATNLVMFQQEIKPCVDANAADTNDASIVLSCMA
ncbi:hypothetical protein [Lysinibacillus fusiformis]